ncbi:hypothetical protein LY76DRAFT_510882 [Colletotrichum caudatum]|nr:hypothetical protein LY76DRAFT_510882 [Colletotrichum caudatum]
MAPRLDKMILDALEEVANKARKPIDDVLRATQLIIDNNIVKVEPAVQDDAPALAEPIAAAASTATKVSARTATKTSAPNESGPAPAIVDTSAPSNKRSAQKPLGSAAKRAAPKVKAPASDSDTVPSEPADNSAAPASANQFPCGFSGCSREFQHKSSRNRVSVPAQVPCAWRAYLTETQHYKINHNGQTP